MRMIASLTAALTFALAGGAYAANLTLVHGIDGSDLGSDQSLPVDIEVIDSSGSQCFDHVTYQTVAPGVAVATGLATVEIRLASTPSCSGTLVAQTSITASLQSDTTVVAHLNDSQQIATSQFSNDLVTPKPGQARLIVRHTADAPAVDVVVNKTIAFSGLTNGNQAKAEGPAGSYDIAINAAGGSHPLVGPLPLTFDQNTVTVLYALSSLRTGNFTVLPEVIDLH